MRIVERFSARTKEGKRNRDLVTDRVMTPHYVSNKREIRRSTNGLVHKYVRFRILRRYLQLLLNVAIIFGLLVRRIPRSNLPVVERNIRLNYNSGSKHLFPLISISFERLIALLLARKNIRGKKYGRTKEENRSYRTTYLWVIADRRLL